MKINSLKQDNKVLFNSFKLTNFLLQVVSLFVSLVLLCFYSFTHVDIIYQEVNCIHSSIIYKSSTWEHFFCGYLELYYLLANNKATVKHLIFQPSL